MTQPRIVTEPGRTAAAHDNGGFMQMGSSERTLTLASKAAGIAVLLLGGLLAATLCFGAPVNPPSVPSIFDPASTPANWVFHFSTFVLAVTGTIFAVVFSLLVYSITKYRQRSGDDGREPAPVYGSNQMELS